MKLGVFNPLFQNMQLEEMLDYIKASGLDAVEVGQAAILGTSTAMSTNCLNPRRQERHIWRNSHHAASSSVLSAATGIQSLRTKRSAGNRMKYCGSRSGWQT